MAAPTRNTLYYGDNLHILRDYVPGESVDLIYLDPPFNSNATYNQLFKEQSGQLSQAQVRAFDDTWTWEASAELTYHELLTGDRAPTQVRDMIKALHQFIGPTAMMAYLVMMTARLIELRRVLKPTGSIYLHCDPTASHYLKVVMDTIFGPRSFRNEIVWKRANSHNDPKRFGRVSDTILYYGKTGTPVWNSQHTPYREDYYHSHFSTDENGRFFRTVPLDAPRHGDGSPALLYEWHGKRPAASRTWAVRKEIMEDYERKGLIRFTRTGTPTLLQYADEMPGVPLQNIWTDIPPVNPQAKERLGYPTQKPLALLERIVQASSNEGDVVLDPFCGCGTAMIAAQKLNRRWLGIDITHLAIALMKNRLKDSFSLEPRRDYDVIGEPVDEESARALAQSDGERYQFQYRAVSLVGARPHDQDRKKGADRGVDGTLRFVDGPKRDYQTAIIQVKSGHVSSRDIRDLQGTMDTQKAVMGLFITLEPPTRDMRQAAVSAGFYHSDV